MNIAYARVRDAAVLAVLLTACSSSSNSAGGNEGDAGRAAAEQDAASEGSSTSSNYDASVDYDAAVAACASSALGQDRVACCEQQLPGGYLTLLDDEEACLCGANGPCTSACNSQECTSLQASTECQICVGEALAGSCKASVASTCASSRGCAAYEACVGGGAGA